MKVVLLETGAVETFNDSYGLRLIEQGKAVPAPEKKPAAKKAEPEKEPEKTGKKK